MTQQNVAFVQSEDEMTDESMIYVYNGYIYQYGKHTNSVVGELKPAFTNLKDQCYFNYGYRYSVSGGKYSAAAGVTTLVVPVPADEATVVVRFKNTTFSTSYTAVNSGPGTDSFTGACTIAGASSDGRIAADSDGVYTYTITKYAADHTCVSFHLTGSGESDFADLIVTVNEPIAYTTETEEAETEVFYNTGCAFAPADYEARIISLEEAVNTLEGKIGTVDETSAVHAAVGTTFPPVQKPAESIFDGYDIDIHSATADDIHAYIDAAAGDKRTVTKEILGKDESGSYDIARYTYANGEHIAWVRDGYPKMYAWKNDSTVIYSVSVSPRKGDTLYTTKYVDAEAAYGTVSGISAANRSRTIHDLEFVRYESGDVEPAVIYTDIDDERNNDTSIIKDAMTYIRYPMGDLGANKEKLIPIFIYANEHGVELAGLDETNEDRYQKYETKMCALIAARLLRDICTDKQSSNPLYHYIREHCMLIVIPVANPFGYNMPVTGITNSQNNGYLNCNNCNINRNYDCPGWDVMNPSGSSAYFGEYPGSENETQYIMNTMVESGAVVAMSLHGLGGMEGCCAHQGQQPDGSDYN